jgi:hypothetical protein
VRRAAIRSIRKEKDRLAAASPKSRSGGSREGLDQGLIGTIALVGGNLDPLESAEITLISVPSPRSVKLMCVRAAKRVSSIRK